jgi:L-lactate dehydrogenase complex protein LldE
MNDSAPVLSLATTPPGAGQLPIERLMSRRVGLFVTCLVDLLRPAIGFAAIRLLEWAGYEVYVPTTQTCCGQPGYNSGDRKSARALAEKTLNEFEGCDYVVVPSGSCGGMIRTHYLDLFQDEPFMLGRVRRLCDRTYELTDFLVNVARIDNVPGRFAGSVTYHDACSGLRELGIKRQPRALLAKVPGLVLKEMDECEQCCGFGGTFAAKHGEISAPMADDKLAQAAATGADYLAACDSGCLLHLAGRRRRTGQGPEPVHIAELLGRALR